MEEDSLKTLERYQNTKFQNFRTYLTIHAYIALEFLSANFLPACLGTELGPRDVTMNGDSIKII